MTVESNYFNLLEWEVLAKILRMCLVAKQGNNMFLG